MLSTFIIICKCSDIIAIATISKGITQYAFRSGPVEEMHSKGKLTQKDMETLNKYMADRIAGLLQTIFNGDVAKALKILTFYASLSSDWNKANPDIEEFYL